MLDFEKGFGIKLKIGLNKIKRIQKIINIIFVYKYTKRKVISFKVIYNYSSK